VSGPLQPWIIGWAEVPHDDAASGSAARKPGSQPTQIPMASLSRGLGRRYSDSVSGSHQDEDDVETRRAARARWLIRRTEADDDGADVLRASTTPEERIAMMDALAREAWALAGRSWPDYCRSAAPIRRTTLAEL